MLRAETTLDFFVIYNSKTIKKVGDIVDTKHLVRIPLKSLVKLDLEKQYV